MCTTLCSKGSYLKMGDKDNSVTMEPLLSPTKSVKPKVKAARFQVDNRKLKVTDSQSLMQVASVGAGDAGEGEAAGAGNEENGWTHQGSQRCLNLIFLGNFLTSRQPAQVPRGRRHGAVHPVCQVPALLPHQVCLQHCQLEKSVLSPPSWMSTVK